MERADGALRLAGELRMPEAAAVWRELRRNTDALGAGRLAIDLSGVRAIDGAVMALIVELRAELAERGVATELTGAKQDVRAVVDLYQADAPPEEPAIRVGPGAVERLGRAALGLKDQLVAAVTFTGSLMLAVVGVLRHPRSGNLKEVAPLVERTGIDAVPIVLFLNFLIGFVMAYQSARQFEMYGANVYVADLVGISVTRELAPLMTGIIVCGRSGAAFAAEIGSMKVSEEVDALRALGLRPVAWLVIPRAVALVIAMPALTLLADVFGILGGLTVAVASLGLSVRAYFSEMQSFVALADVGQGLVKSAVYGVAIAFIACQQGFAASGGAEGVGRRTTSTVVTSLFALVVLDVILTVIFRVFGH